MAISLLGSVGSNNGTGATVTISHTVPADTDVLVVCAQEFGSTSDTTTASCTYGGVSMNIKVSRGADIAGTSDAKSYIFYLNNPTATTADVVFTCGDTTPSWTAIQASNWDGVDVSGDPFEASNSATALTGAPSVAVVTLTDGAVVLDSMLVQDATPVVDASQTLLASAANGGLQNGGGSSYELKATAGSVTMSWADEAGDDWITCAAALKPAGADPPAAATGTTMLMMGV